MRKLSKVSLDTIPEKVLVITGEEAINYLTKKMKKKNISLEATFQDRSDDIYEIDIANAQGKTKICRYTEHSNEVLPLLTDSKVMDLEEQLRLKDEENFKLKELAQKLRTHNLTFL